MLLSQFSLMRTGATKAQAPQGSQPWRPPSCLTSEGNWYRADSGKKSFSVRASVVMFMYLVFSVAYLYAYSYVLMKPAFKLYSTVRLAFNVLLFSKCFDYFIADTTS